MLASVRALLSGIIDYAGLFPPAKLPMDEAFRNYLRYRTEPESWLLGRFICPAARLHELSAFHEEIVGAPVVISALGRGGASAQDFLAGVGADLQDIAQFHERFGNRAVVEVYETKLPPGLFEATAGNQLFALLGATAFLVENPGPASLALFYEPPSARHKVVQAIIDALAADRASPEASGRRRCSALGLKLRCGGLEPADMPTTAQLAFAITYCRDQAGPRAGPAGCPVPIKFTAGLHHPLRHFDKNANSPAHGFLNVFIAGALAKSHNLKEATVQRILEVESASDFTFEDHGIYWNSLKTGPSGTAYVRGMLVTSFGSCSFDEPREDLRALGLIP